MGTSGGSVLREGRAAQEATAPERHVQLWGTHPRSLDDRGRISIPTTLRWAFEEGVALVPWPGPCLALLPTHELIRLERRMRKKEQDLRGDQLARDALTELATHTFLDAQGRVFMTPEMRLRCGIERELLLVGRVRRLEVWSPQSREPGRSERADALAAHLITEAE